MIGSGRFCEREESLGPVNVLHAGSWARRQCSPGVGDGAEDELSG